MKLLFQLLLLVVIVALQKCQDGWILDLNQDYDDGYYDFTMFEPQTPTFTAPTFTVPTFTAPNITVYRPIEDREHDSVIVLCMFDPMFGMSWQMPSFELSVESELNYSKKMEECIREMCVFVVTVSPPASFTCVQEIHSDGEVKYSYSQTYNYNKSGVSLFYIGFSSSIAVGLFIMTVAVIVTTIRSKAKDPIDPTSTVTDNDYMDA